MRTRKKCKMTKLYFKNILYPNLKYPWTRQNITNKKTIGVFDNKIQRSKQQHLIVHSIDPKGSKDVDDAFSLEETEEGLFLHVHICDPSAYIEDIKSPSLQCAAKNGSSFYPSGHKTKRMFDDLIRKQCSLSRGKCHVTTVSFLFNDDESKILQIRINPATIYCDPKNSHSYENAAMKYRNRDPYVRKIHRLSLVLQQELSSSELSLLPEPVVFGEMTYLHHSIPKVQSSSHCRVILVPDSSEKIEVKRMVALMATAVNGVLANLIALNGTGLESYLDRKVGLYTHFTSPLRRFRDCMLHIELKQLLLHLNKPTGLILPNDFDKLQSHPIQHSVFGTQLSEMLETCLAAEKKQQQLHSQSMQFRFLQYMYQRVNMDGARRVRIKSRVTRRTPSYIYLNIYIIDGHSVRMKHIVPRQKKEDTEDNTPGAEHEFNITVCNLPRNKFNDGTLPQIEVKF